MRSGSGLVRFLGWLALSMLLSYGILVAVKWSSEPETARHEAGHAVACYVGFGKAPHSMALTTFRLGGELGYTKCCSGDGCPSSLGAADLWHTLVMLFAGMAATSSSDGGDGDIRASLHVIALLLDLQAVGQDIRPPWSRDPFSRRLSPDDISDEAWRQAKEVVERHRRQVDALTDALLRRGSLDHDEIEAILTAVGE